jgi:hypothetical protein
MRADALDPLLPAIAAALACEHMAEQGAPALRVALVRAVTATIDAAVVARSASAPGAIGGGADAAASRRRVQRSFSCASAYDAAERSAATRLSGAASLDDATLDSLLIALLVCCEQGGAPDDAIDAAIAAAHRLAVALGFCHSAQLYADAAHRLLPRICAEVGSWTPGAPGRRLFDTLLRVGRPALSGRSSSEAHALVAGAVEVFAASLAPSGDPALRIAMIALCDAFITGAEEGGGGGGSEGRLREGSRRPPASSPEEGGAFGEGDERGAAAEPTARGVLDAGGVHSLAGQGPLSVPLHPGLVPDNVSARMDIVPTLIAPAASAAVVRT